MAFLTGSGPQVKTLPRYSPSQTNLANILGSNSQSLVNSLMQQQGQNGFGPIAQRARTQFHQNTVPTIAERFTSMGHGAQSSPAFAHLLGQSGANLEEGLASQEAQYALQQRGLDQSLLSMLLGGALQPQFENIYNQSQPGFLQSILPALGSLAGGFTGAGGSLGSLLASLFGGAGTSESSNDDLGRQAPVNQSPLFKSPFDSRNAIDISMYRR